MSAPSADAETFLAASHAVAAHDPALTLLEAGILAGHRLGLAADSRTFARVFGLAHALVLRAVEGLVGAGLVAVTGRDGRTQRTRYAPSAAAETLLRGCGLATVTDAAASGR